MKKCPYCAQENEDGAVVCSICHVELDPPSAPQVDPQLQDPTLSLRIVATFRNVVDAGLFRARLEAAGIEACMPEEYTPQIFWNVIPSPLESVTVRVAAKDYEAAKGLLAEYVDASLPVSQPGAAGAEEDTASEGDRVDAEVADEPQSRKLCVACGAEIAEGASLCPKCGWTQPGF
jgi:ribosomal protein L40E